MTSITNMTKDIPTGESIYKSVILGKVKGGPGKGSLEYYRAEFSKNGFKILYHNFTYGTCDNCPRQAIIH
jgi:hypothetical protein